MEQRKFNELLALVQKELAGIPLTGVRGQISFKFFRSFGERRDFKLIMREEMSTEKKLDALRDHIKQHYVAKAEGDIYKCLHSIVVDYDLLRTALFNFFLLEYNEIKDMRRDIEEDIRFFGKMHLGEEQRKQVTKVIIDFLDGWMEDLKQVRELINSAWAKAKGNVGWAGSLFKALHKEGYFIRFQERRHFKNALKDAIIVEDNIKQLGHIKSQKDLEKCLNRIKDKSPEMKEHVKVLDEMLFNTWNHINDQLRELTKIIYESATQHELPAMDKEQIEKLHDVIINKLEEKFLHALRIDEAQMEQALADLEQTAKRLAA